MFGIQGISDNTLTPEQFIHNLEVLMERVNGALRERNIHVDYSYNMLGIRSIILADHDTFYNIITVWAPAGKSILLTKEVATLIEESFLVAAKDHSPEGYVSRSRELSDRLEEMGAFYGA